MFKGALFWITVARGCRRPTARCQPVVTSSFTRSAAMLSSVQGEALGQAPNWESKLRDFLLTGVSFGPEGE